LQTTPFIAFLLKGTTRNSPKESLPYGTPYAAALVVLTVPFAAYSISILYSFYGIGSSFHDAGWSAYLIHESDFLVHNPPCVDDGVSWFNSHISPLFLATSGLGRLLPLTRIQFYAAYIGVSHALPAIAVFWLLMSGYHMTRPVPCFIAALLALFFSFDGLALAIARFPHFTMFLVGTGIMFLVAMVLGRVKIAALFFLLCLSTREDAGFHLFALLSILFFLERGEGIPFCEQRPILGFAIVGLVYSASAVSLQHALSDARYSLLINEYLGNPLFSQVEPGLILRRLLGWFAYRPYVVFPAICTLVWAIVRRNPYLMLGYVAFLPWGLLHLIAAREMVGTLPSYYAFPYMFANLWPLISLLIQQRQSEGHRSILEPVCGFALLILTSFITAGHLHNPTHLAFPIGFVSPPSIARQAAVDNALQRLAATPARQELGATLVDQSVAALVPERYQAENILSAESHLEPDSIIFFTGGFESALARNMAAKAGLEREYEIAGTPIRVGTNHSLSNLHELTAVRASDYATGSVTDSGGTRSP